MFFIAPLLPSPTDQFEVSNIIGLTGEATNGNLIGLTNFALYAILVTGLVIGLHLLADNDSRLVPSHWSVVVETIYASVQSFSADQLGARNMEFFPFVYGLFVALLFTDLVGNVPYSFTLSSTAIMTMGLSLTVFIGVTIMGLLIHRLHFFAYFIP